MRKHIISILTDQEAGVCHRPEGCPWEDSPKHPDCTECAADDVIRIIVTQAMDGLKKGMVI